MEPLLNTVVNQNVTEYKFPCDVCEGVFETSMGLRMHKLHYHGVARTPKQATCDECGRVFTNLNILKNHKRTEHVSEEGLSKIECRCDKCNLVFTNSVVLNHHLLNCLDVPKTFQCKICIEEKPSWHSTVALQRHIAEIHRMVRHVCETCGIAKKSLGLLNKHIAAMHTQQDLSAVAAFACNKCEKVLVSKYALKRHINTVHEKIKMFKCDECNGSFSDGTVLRRHKHTKHIKATLFECELCNYSTYTPGAVRTHVRYVHEKAPIKKKNR
jgi:KRAB domain-containing zinc finger protein